MTEDQDSAAFDAIKDHAAIKRALTECAPLTDLLHEIEAAALRNNGPLARDRDADTLRGIGMAIQHVMKPRLPHEAEAVSSQPKLTLCRYCGSWNLKPCGNGCQWGVRFDKNIGFHEIP